jgi:dTDP-4-dehydrorhamnose reductase
LRRALPSRGKVTALGQGECDLRLPGVAESAISKLRPDLVIIAAAYTAVDLAEDDRASCQRINADAVGEIARACARLGSPVVHYSTDYVFAGSASLPYQEDDATGPRSVYGTSKLAGEDQLRDSGVPHLIFRTSWVYGSRGKNFALTILRAALGRPLLRVVDDQHGSPTWSRTIAQSTALVIAKACALGPLPDVMARKGGTYHLTASGATTWHGFAQRLCAWQAERQSGRSVATVEPTTTAEYGAKAPRPTNSRLDCARLANEWQLALPAWQNDLKLVLEEVSEQQPVTQAA